MQEERGQANAVSGANGRRSGIGGNGSGESVDAQAASGVGQTEVNEWTTQKGSVTSIDESSMVIQLNSVESVTVEGRPWRFAQEQCFSAAVGDEVAQTGFYDGEQFEAGQLSNTTTNLVITIRQENGRPLWAGGSSS